MELFTIVLRTVLVYFFILFIMRMMGKREIGKLSVFDLVVSIMIAELAVLSIDEIEAPMINSLTPIIVLVLTQMVISFLSLKSQKVREILDGKPSILIENGKIREKELKKQRYNLDDLMLQLRQNHIHSINQVEFAILEPSGRLTILPKSESENVSKSDLQIPTKKYSLPEVLIKDGIVQKEALTRLGRNTFWLKSELRKRVGTSEFKKISLCSIDPKGIWYVDFKD